MDHTSSLFNGVDEKTQNDAPEYPLCGICGEPHESSDCDIVCLKTTIRDTPVLSKARLSLPSNLQLVIMADGTNSIITNELIQKGTRFGPYEAKEQFTISPSVDLPLKVFKDAEDNYFKEYYLNNTNEFECNWMYFVNKANNLDEQNLICFQDKGRIFYISIRDIQRGEHLHVWYAPYYGKLMKMGSYYDKVQSEDDSSQSNIDVNELMKKQHNIRDRKTWICKFCGKQEANIQTFAIHITDHYTAQLRKTCEICKQRFFTVQSLKKHMFLAHNDTATQSKTPIEVQNKQSIDTDQENLFGPLLNEVPTESNVLFEHLNFQDTSSMQSETMTLNVDNILNEDENFNFEMPKDMDKEQDKDKFVCDICLKKFVRLKFLIIHLSAHTGKNTCKQCLTVFTRKENLMAHKCLSCTTTTDIKCTICAKRFTLSKYLRRHMIFTHGQGFTCTKQCKRKFATQKTLDAHNCEQPKDGPTGENAFTCQLCAKKFGNGRNLRRHLKTHENNSTNVTNVYICEVCSKQFKSKKSLKQHLNSHKEPEFSCKLCDKTFTRRTAFTEHMDIHKNETPHVCNICNAKFTLKKYLTNHQLLHTDELKFKCNECPQRFRHKVNLTKHHNNSHVKTCKECSKIFSTVDEYKNHLLVAHMEKVYECPVCKIRVKLRSSLKRHVKQKHAQDDFDITKLDEYMSENGPKDAKTAQGKSSFMVESPSTSEGVPGLVPVSSSSTDVGILQASQSVPVQTRDDVLKLKVPPDEMLNQCLLPDSLQVNVMQDLESNLQLDDIVNVLGGKPGESNENVLDYSNIAMDFENSYVKQGMTSQADVGITHSFDNGTVCLSMPELNEHGQPVNLGDNLHSSLILENVCLNDGQEPVVLYILDQKPS